MSGTSEDCLPPSQTQIDLIVHYKKRSQAFLAGAVLSTVATVGLGYSASEEFKQVSSGGAEGHNTAVVGVVMKGAGVMAGIGATVLFGRASSRAYGRSRKHRRGKGRSGPVYYRDGHTVNYEEIGGP